MAATDLQLSGSTPDAPAAGGPDRRRPPWQRLWPRDRCAAAFVLLSLLFGLAFALVNPPLWGQDEFSHVARAYSIDHGRLLPQPFRESGSTNGGTNYGGLVPEPVRALHDLVTANLTHATRVLQPRLEAQLSSLPVDSPLVYAGFPNSSAYSPLPYLPSVVGLRIAETGGASVGTAILVMRLCDLLCYAAVGWLALRSLRAARLKWLVFCVALLPMAVYDAAMVTADTLTNALALLLGVLVVKAVFLRSDLSRAETGLLFAAVVLLPLAKPTYAVLDLLLLVVPASRLPGAWRGRGLRAGVAAVALAACGGWALLSSGVDGAMRYMRPDTVLDPRTQLDVMVRHFPRFAHTAARTVLNLGDTYLTQFFASLGIVYLPAPTSVVICCTLAGVVAFGLAERVSATGRQWVAAAAILLLNVIAIFVVEWVEWSRIGAPVIEGVQGRYFIPLAVVTGALALQVIPLRIAATTVVARRTAAAWVVALMTVALAWSVVAFYRALWL